MQELLDKLREGGTVELTVTDQITLMDALEFAAIQWKLMAESHERTNPGSRPGKTRRRMAEDAKILHAMVAEATNVTMERK